jgi:DNA (cytosine-5)-methyltransferase 1
MPRWVVIENVPGLLSSQRGRDMGAVVGALVELGYGVAWRVLDAQGFGVPQQRRRVFIVGNRDSVERAGEVLFEREGVCGNSAPRRQEREDATADVPQCLTGGCDASKDGSGRGTPIVAVYENQQGEIYLRPTATAVACSGGKPGQGYQAIFTFQPRAARCGRGMPGGIVPALNASETGMHGDSQPHVWDGYSLRRLMPVECERLQGFPDDWTAGHSDTARYRMLGNAVAVPVAKWIGERVMELESRTGADGST